MKLRITLTKSQYEALAAITGNLTGLIREENDFDNYCCLAALEELALRFLPKMHAGAVKKKQTICLTDMQTLAFYTLLNEYVDLFHPYEHTLGCSILAQIDRQFKHEAALRRSIRSMNYLR